MAFALFVDSSAPTHAQSAPQAVSLAVDANSHTWLLWDNPDGSASLWNLDASGSLVANYAYGPYTDNAPQNTWSATAVSVGPNGVVHLLWNNTDRRAMFWNVSATDGTFTRAGYGPYTDNAPQNLWNVTALATGPDGLNHLLWGNTDHRAMLWSVDASFNFNLAGYGPYTDNYVSNDPGNLWDAVSVSAGPDGLTHLLWRNVDHRAMFWNVDSGFNILGVVGYGPYSDNAPQNIWDALAVATGPDNISHLLWKNMDGRAMFWNIHADTTFDVFGYGPYTGLAISALAVGPDSMARILWDGPNGSAQVWTINPSGGYTPIIYSAVASLDLTAAASGSNQVTLYWNGVTGASGYNVYRGAVSGGPYSLVAANVSNPNNGPGKAGSFMYTDANGLTMGTEYFYIVTAVQSGVETVQSNEDSATPDASAVPWATGDPAQIVAAVNATAANDLQPDVDDGGVVTPQQVGVLFIGGPDGVVYLGNVDSFTPPQAYAAPGYAIGNTLVGNDGTVTSFADGPSGNAPIPSAIKRSNDALGLWSDDLLSPRLTTADTYPYRSTSPPTGIYRKVESAPGFNGLSAYIGLPRSSDANAVHLLHHLSTSAGSQNSDTGKDYPSTGDIYTGGAVYSPNGAEGFEVDAGLQLTPDPNINTSTGWSPIVSNRRRIKFPNDNKLSPETADKIYLDGTAHALPVGNQPGALLYKMHMQGEIHMQFLTPKSASVRDESVRLHFSPAPYLTRGLGEPIGVISLDKRDPTTNQLISTRQVPYLTLEYFGVLGWHKAHGTFIIKRVNSIAQTLNSPAAPGAPQANAPSNSATKGYLADGSFIRHAPGDNYSSLNSGASWGMTAPTDVALLSPTGAWQPWTNDVTVTGKAGSYPAVVNSSTIGVGAVMYNTFNTELPFYFETDISLTMK